MDVSNPPPTPAADMVDYYRRRAAYYERVYQKPERQADLRAMEAWVAEAFRGRRVLELACGTGWWTPHGARHCEHWLATDLNPETMALAREKPLPPGKVEFAIADAYALAGLGERRFDAGFAGFWWSHVPLGRLSAWIDTLHARLEDGARVVVMDNRFVPGSSLPLDRLDAEGNSYQTRELDDGSLHEVLKNFPTREQVQALLGARASDFGWTEWTHYWAASWRVAPRG
ncbi:class I SAM-dependent methyltransferase [Roseateles violae]|uniref:Class I SAM-dependent methyltransferase n=1 Tax=Roseateles violae TaxID=3058042 RepID=A0ABT8DM92_9BURK|nr:class I SAM-dependent methyltransferase [Pelomonas sp. PFR6]MDN3919527.1 class I SAM-dependent methyltransferase [Pelomonas sp. PFR6]